MMKKKYFFILITLCCCGPVFAQQNVQEKPRLVVGIVIDQMRWDYLYRYRDNYGQDGFNRLLQDGFSCENTFIPYLPTYTAPGHTCVYTGSIPAFHGIVGNDWYNIATKSNMYCTQDTSVSTLGSTSSNGKMSPRNMLASTVTDELRLASNFNSKVIGVAIKDRGAILPAGHAANAAYWFDDTNGGWISSTYYQDDLPAWVKTENDKQYPAKAMAGKWELSMPADKYKWSSSDNKAYEGTLPEEKSPVFPHNLAAIGKSKFSAFKYTPFAATYTFNMAKEAIRNEKLGSGKYTDMLTVSISSTDYMGHTFGPNSLEAEDTYARLDKDLAGFLSYLDETIGKGQYLVFLTADHGAANVPGYLQENKIPAGTFSSRKLEEGAKLTVKDKFSIGNAILKFQNNQVYLDEAAIKTAGKDVAQVEEAIIDYLVKQPFIEFAFATSRLQSTTLPAHLKEMATNGYNPKRSGQIGYVANPSYFSGGSTGTTHGMWNPYDTHIPLIWFGKGITPGKTHRETYMTDIAPTLAAILNIQTPSATVGKVITEVTK